MGTGGDSYSWGRPHCLLFFILLISFIWLPHIASGDGSPSAPVAYAPPDNYLINCGSKSATHLEDGRTYKSDSQAASLLYADDDFQVSQDSLPPGFSLPLNLPLSSQPLYATARVFPRPATYSFFISRPGLHWVRLYFYAIPDARSNLTGSVFSVSTADYVLMHDFSVEDGSMVVFKEYLLNVTGEKFCLRFTPKRNNVAFVNGIEVVSAPDSLLSDSAANVSPLAAYSGLSKCLFEVCYRMNVGGPPVYPEDDPLSRTWESDFQYNMFFEGAQNVSVAPNRIRYPESGGASPLIAPHVVYATADKMAESGVQDSNFNLTWRVEVDSSYWYLIRLHFCDIVSKSLNDMYFNVYVNQMMAVPGLDLSSLTGGLAVPFFKDFVIDPSFITNGSIEIQLGPATSVESSAPNAILNGLEVLKINNSVGSLDGMFSVDGVYRGHGRLSLMKVGAGIGLVFSAAAVLLLAAIFVRGRQRPQGWEKRNSFSSWLLPVHSGNASFMSSKSWSRKTGMSCTSVSKSGHSSFVSTNGLGRRFTFNEIQEATQNFDEKAVIGVGGFGKVYLGTSGAGVKLAVKRGNPNSQQGMHEFQTEIILLSRLRHRHLVSLVGYCEEKSEMILVYEYMANGPLRDHLYGSSLPILPWKKRLEICIGAARGLHYLHTGAEQNIIHRDVKTTNILLDDNFVAKMADFGLSKAAPSLDGNTHVSTAVKGSFGYLDPEYFRRQQLTEKSDVYSFGVVLFEVLCARPAVDPSLPREQVSLAEWAMKWHRKGQLGKIVDKSIIESISPNSLKKFAEAAEKCLAEYGVDRPPMGDVLWSLEYALQLQVAANAAAAEETEDKSLNLIKLDVEDSDEAEEAKGLPSSSSTACLLPDSAGASDVSEVNMGAPVFSQIVNFQGR
uniref:Protein kinase domain-containing protein n=1 Tax=Kalanchoe fedtschenkoi TaxID=63787 RepID=A0A7N0U068_KALFE